MPEAGLYDLTLSDTVKLSRYGFKLKDVQIATHIRSQFSINN